MKDFSTIIANMDLPSQLKEYLNNRKEMQNIITKEILKEVEEIYVLYRSLYFFDTTEFSLYSIIVLKKSPELDSVFYYLRKVIDIEVPLISKGDEDNFILVKSNLFDNEFKKFTTLFSTIADKNCNEEIVDLKDVYQALGKLDLINEIVIDEDWKQLFNMGKILVKNYESNIHDKYIK
ncbi:hypothetical protein [Sporosarcina ureae]|uniref:hypothetical protein n=1 Tax=Sporosarcina ureae TaxID=1571 RepID=UPI000A17A0E9|nr:hypothetical protein [Sporosarcina ureae]ARK21870.1 hypothetical protein SporoP32a_10245 [Sporosarcina ureae]